MYVCMYICIYIYIYIYKPSFGKHEMQHKWDHSYIMLFPCFWKMNFCKVPTFGHVSDVVGYQDNSSHHVRISFRHLDGDRQHGRLDRGSNDMVEW